MTDDDILRIAKEIWTGSDLAIVGANDVHSFARRILAEAQRGAEPTIEECFAAGKGPQTYGEFKEGGFPDTPEERERFEAYMRGHCWSVGNYNASIHAYDTTSVRMLYGIWRDRGSLAAPQRTAQEQMPETARTGAAIQPESSAPAAALTCLGYPHCDGDLVAEPHSPDCPAAARSDMPTPSVCPECGNSFLQPFVCITCGAEKLYDATVAELRAALAAERRASKCYENLYETERKVRERAEARVRELEGKQ